MTEEKAKTRITPLGQLQRYKVMQLVEKSDRNMPDIDLASKAADLIGRPVAQGVIAEYRRIFGYQSVKAPKAADLRQRVLDLEAQIAATKADPNTPPAEPVGGVARVTTELPPVGDVAATS